MQLDSSKGMTVSEAKATFDNGNVTGIRVDVFNGEFYMVICTKIGEKPIRTQRNTYKFYKSFNSLINDYKSITSNDIKSLILKWTHILDIIEKYWKWLKKQIKYTRG